MIMTVIRKAKVVIDLAQVAYRYIKRVAFAVLRIREPIDDKIVESVDETRVGNQIVGAFKVPKEDIREWYMKGLEHHTVEHQVFLDALEYRGVSFRLRLLRYFRDIKRAIMNDRPTVNQWEMSYEYKGASHAFG